MSKQCHPTFCSSKSGLVKQKKRRVIIRETVKSVSSGNLKPTQLIFGYILMMFSSKLTNVYSPRNIFEYLSETTLAISFRFFFCFFCKPIILNQSVSMSKSRHRLRQKLSISIASVQNLSISITEHLHFIHTQRKKSKQKKIRKNHLEKVIFVDPNDRNL